MNTTLLRVQVLITSRIAFGVRHASYLDFIQNLGDEISEHEYRAGYNSIRAVRRRGRPYLHFDEDSDTDTINTLPDRKSAGSEPARRRLAVSALLHSINSCFEL